MLEDWNEKIWLLVRPPTGEHRPYRTDVFPDRMKKQNVKEPSFTVVVHLYKDGHVFIHPIEAYSITVREVSRNF